MNQQSWRMISGIILLLLLSNISAFAENQNRKTKSVDERIKNLENPLKEKLKQPGKVLDALGVKEGETVADVGAGTGLFAFQLAPRVGSAGKVYAVEIEDQLLEFIRNKAEQNRVKNIILIKSSESDPNLPPASCDKILMAGVYYYLADPVAFMEKIGKALKPGGMLAIIDLNPEKLNEGVKSKKLRRPDEVADEMKRAGFKLHESHDFLANRFFLVFAAAE